jgi:16S rRNA (cytosine967-C5)-methyltransferase
MDAAQRNRNSAGRPKPPPRREARPEGLPGRFPGGPRPSAVPSTFRKSRSSPLELAERIVRGASRDRPADAVMRQVLQSEPDLFPGDASQVSCAVFAYYRWLGWLERQASLHQQIRQATGLAEEFAASPGSLSDAELVARAVPSWLKTELEVTAAWARTLQAEPKLWLRARPGQGQAVAGGLGDCVPFGKGPLADTLEYHGSTDLFRTEAFHAGKFELQDLSSQAVGWVCAPQPGQTWWDACAGEGGKLLHLSALMGNKGLLWASDRAAWRLQKLKRRAARAKVFNYRAATWDGGPKLPTKTRFDGVLVDAPCSGVGTWHRNPHARWTTNLADVHELGELQVALLSHAAAALKPGGKLVYAICTTTRSETDAVVAAFERSLPGFQRMPFSNPLRSGGALSPQLHLRPEDFGGNGMFIAAWTRA